MIDNSGEREDINVDKTESYNKDRFHSTFQQNKTSNSSQIVQYSVPQAIQNGSHEKELGKENNNFTSYNRNLNVT